MASFVPAGPAHHGGHHWLEHLMPPLNLPLSILGRPVKPVSFSFTLAMLIIVYINVTATGVVGALGARHFLAAVAGIAVVLSVWGWAGRSQRAAEWALLTVAFVWAIRFWAGGLTMGFSLSNEGVWFSFCWSLVASGSFWLERSDGHFRRERE